MLRRMLQRGTSGHYSPKRVGRRAFRRLKSFIISSIFLIIVVVYFLFFNR